MLVMQDNTGTIAFPVWDNYENLNSHININLVVNIKGIVTRFNGNIQIRNPIINIVNEEIDYGLYVYQNMIFQKSLLIEYFNNIVNNLEENIKK